MSIKKSNCQNGGRGEVVRRMTKRRSKRSCKGGRGGGNRGRGLGIGGRVGERWWGRVGERWWGWAGRDMEKVRFTHWKPLHQELFFSHSFCLFQSIIAFQLCMFVKMICWNLMTY